MTVSKITLYLLTMSLMGCATTSTRNKILRDMLIGAGVGVLLAQSKTESRQAYATMYGGVGATASGAVSVYVNSSNDDRLITENDTLKKRLEQVQRQLQPQLLQKGNSLFASPIPQELSSLVDPGEWRRYKMDQWVQDPNQTNTWYRQVEMFEIIPPVSK